MTNQGIFLADENPCKICLKVKVKVKVTRKDIFRDWCHVIQAGFTRGNDIVYVYGAVRLKKQNL